MLKQLTYRQVLRMTAVVFVIFEIILFPLIQIPPADISSAASYVAIVLVALFALITWRGERDGHIIRLGILFTLLADTYMVIYERMLEGVMCFILVQACYFAYLLVREERKIVKLWNIYSRIVLMSLLVISAFLVLGDDVDALAISSVVYYGNLIANTVFAFLRFREERIFAIGLFLFAMCDLTIGLDALFIDYLHSYALSGVFNYPYANIPWIFYQPSQVLIGLRLYSKIKA